MNAPIVSIARCSPNALPRASGSQDAAIIASRAEVRMPLPTRSISRETSTRCHDDASARSGLLIADRL